LFSLELAKDVQLMKLTYSSARHAIFLVLAVLISVLTHLSTTLADAPADWPLWGYDLGNSRYNAEETTITPSNVGQLKLLWAFAFPDTMVASSQPTVEGDTVYVGSWNGNVYALDTKSGKPRWEFSTGLTGVRGIVRVGVAVTEKLVVFGDQLGRVFAVNKDNGSLAWIQNTFEKHPLAQITGSPVVYQDRVYVTMASREEAAGEDPTYPCCTFRGSLTAINLSDGSVAWRFFTVDEAKSSPATETPLGPSGVGVWSTPAIDPEAGLIYFTTGNAYTPPVPTTADAIVAVNLDDGTLRWTTQLTPNDFWNNGCDQTPSINCEGEPGEDYDFSSSAMLVDTSVGKLVVGIQKNGNLNALDRLTGKSVWQASVGAAVAINWGTTFDGKRIYTGDASFDRNGGVYALDAATGKITWQVEMPSCKPGPKVPEASCWSGNMNAVSSSPSLVWIAANDGQVHAFDAESGKVVWSYNTAHNVVGTNGVRGNGGSIAAAGITVAHGQVYVTSGYSPWTPSFIEGNVLFAFGFPVLEEF
jgi:polyvinyl alcohol dehydrogenase (cytochrome)